jgi:hypothetical protein
MTDPNQPVFTDPRMARFFAVILPYYAALWFAVSPLGWLTWRGVRWAADRLHKVRAHG